MPRPPRADETGGLYHALNRGNLRAGIFLKDADFAAFERILHEALQIYQVELYAYQLMSNHYHLVLRPLDEDKVSGTNKPDAAPRRGKGVRTRKRCQDSITGDHVLHRSEATSKR